MCVSLDGWVYSARTVRSCIDGNLQLRLLTTVRKTICIHSCMRYVPSMDAFYSNILSKCMIVAYYVNHIWTMDELICGFKMNSNSVCTYTGIAEVK